MSDLQVLGVVGSLSSNSATRIVVRELEGLLKNHGAVLDMLDFGKEPLELFDPENTYSKPFYPVLKKRIECSDVILLATPDYHGSMSGVLKNFLDHFWTEFAGKLFVPIVASHEKGLTVTDQIRTVARQCYAWTIPYNVSFADKVDVVDGRVVGDAFRKRLEMLSQDIMNYGSLLAEQRRRDMSGKNPGFMARYRE